MRDETRSRLLPTSTVPNYIQIPALYTREVIFFTEVYSLPLSNGSHIKYHCFGQWLTWEYSADCLWFCVHRNKKLLLLRCLRVKNHPVKGGVKQGQQRLCQFLANLFGVEISMSPEIYRGIYY